MIQIHDPKTVFVISLIQFIIFEYEKDLYMPMYLIAPKLYYTLARLKMAFLYQFCL